MNKEYYKNVEEIWKDITGYIGLYMVSNWGRIKRLIGKGCRQERILKLSKDSDGYLIVHLSKNNNKKLCKVHQLVLKTFVGPCPVGMEGCHNNGNPSDNFVGNLRWDTKKENCKDRKNHGNERNQNGSKNNMAKLNDDKIINIRKLSSKGKSDGEIAKLIGVCRQTINNIVNYKTWKHVK